MARRTTAVMMRGGIMRSADTIAHNAEVLARGIDAGHVERDGRSYRLVRLPDAVAPPDVPVTVAPREMRQAVTIVA